MAKGHRRETRYYTRAFKKYHTVWPYTGTVSISSVPSISYQSPPRRAFLACFSSESLSDLMSDTNDAWKPSMSQTSDRAHVPRAPAVTPIRSLRVVWQQFPNTTKSPFGFCKESNKDDRAGCAFRIRWRPNPVGYSNGTEMYTVQQLYRLIITRSVHACARGSWTSSLTQSTSCLLVLLAKAQCITTVAASNISWIHKSPMNNGDFCSILGHA